MTSHEPSSGPESTSIFHGGLIHAEPTHEAEQPAQPLPQAEGLTPGTALLVVKRGPNVGSRYSLEADMVSAGRHPDSDIFLDDVSVSRRHAQFRRVVNNGYEVVDVGSLNGTYVNREAVESAPLAHGDEIQIGKFRLVYFVVDQLPGAAEGP